MTSWLDALNIAFGVFFGAIVGGVFVGHKKQAHGKALNIHTTWLLQIDDRLDTLEEAAEREGP